jgi:hypothetical protein
MKSEVIGFNLDVSPVHAYGWDCTLSGYSNLRVIPVFFIILLMVAEVAQKISIPMFGNGWQSGYTSKCKTRREMAIVFLFVCSKLHMFASL